MPEALNQNLQQPIDDDRENHQLEMKNTLRGEAFHVIQELLAQVKKIDSIDNVTTLKLEDKQEYDVLVSLQGILTNTLSPEDLRAPGLVASTENLRTTLIQISTDVSNWNEETIRVTSEGGVLAGNFPAELIPMTPLFGRLAEKLPELIATLPERLKPEQQQKGTSHKDTPAQKENTRDVRAETTALLMKSGLRSINRLFSQVRRLNGGPLAVDEKDALEEIRKMLIETYDTDDSKLFITYLDSIPTSTVHLYDDLPSLMLSISDWNTYSDESKDMIYTGGTYPAELKPIEALLKQLAVVLPDLKRSLSKPEPAKRSRQISKGLANIHTYFNRMLGRVKTSS